MSDRPRIVEDAWNADWTKQSWDLPFQGPDDLQNLRDFIRSSGMTVEQFKRLPVYRLNVDKMSWVREL